MEQLNRFEIASIICTLEDAERFRTGNEDAVNLCCEECPLWDAYQEIGKAICIDKAHKGLEKLRDIF